MNKNYIKNLSLWLILGIFSGFLFLNFNMENKKSLFQKPYDIKDVSVLFGIVAFLLIISALLGNNLFGIFQENINFG